MSEPGSVFKFITKMTYSLGAVLGLSVALMLNSGLAAGKPTLDFNPSIPGQWQKQGSL